MKMIAKVDETEILKFDKKYYYHPAFEFPAGYKFVGMFTRNILGDHDLPENDWNFYCYGENACFMETSDSYVDPCTGEKTVNRRFYKIDGEYFDNARNALNEMMKYYSDIKYDAEEYAKLDSLTKEYFDEFNDYMYCKNEENNY